jgi:hypothetical protein
MKDLILQALDDAYLILQRRIPLTTKHVESMSIIDVSPIELRQFMIDNNIPDNAYFSGEDDGYHGYSDFLICWDIDRVTTDNEKLSFQRNSFTRIAAPIIQKLLLQNNYKRIPVTFGNKLWKTFQDTTVYDMYIEKKYDLLVSYYSEAFELND